MPNRKRNIIVVVFGWLSAYSALTYGAWTETIVDSSPHTSSMSIDIDSNGFAHISYTDGDDLRYTKYTGSDWVIESFNLPGTVAKNSQTSVQVDSQGHAHIAYMTEEGGPGYAKYNGSGWDITAGIGIGAGLSISLGLDDNGYAQISYFDDLVANLHIAKFNGTDWSDQVVQAGGFVSTSIAMDNQGYARISYHDVTFGNLYYAQFNGTGWANQAVDIGGDTGSNTSIAVDTLGHNHISYVYNDTQDLKYAYFNGTNWVLYTLDTGDVKGYTSIETDSENNVFISYIASSNGGTLFDLKLATFNGTGWSTETLYTNISSLGGEPSDTSLVLFNDYVYITYGHGGLAMTTNAPAGFVPEPTLDILGKILLSGIPLGVVFYRAQHKK